MATPLPFPRGRLAFLIALLLLAPSPAGAVVNVDLTVHDNGKPVASATIVIKDKSGGTVATHKTDGTGRLAVALPDCGHTVVVRYGFFDSQSKQTPVPCNGSMGTAAGQSMGTTAGGSGGRSTGVTVSTGPTGRVAISVDLSQPNAEPTASGE
jgi:hypothetical protein